MTRRPVAALAGLVVAGSLALPAPANASAGPCADQSAITVVVDPGPLGERVRVGCSPSGGGTSAADAVQDAGFEITYAEGQPFLCRLDGRPDATQESCARTPPADAYWGFFWSDGQEREWTYATLGIAALEVPPGGSVGLRFQDGGRLEDPSLPPAGGADASVQDADRAAATETESGASSRETGRSRTEGDNALMWTAGGAVLALTAATVTLARRRRG